MGFLVTTLIFIVIGIIASLCTRICCNRGPSTNLLHLTLVITATVCCWMMETGRVDCSRHLDCCFVKGHEYDDIHYCCDRIFGRTYRWWAIVYLAQMKPLIVPILSEGE